MSAEFELLWSSCVLGSRGPPTPLQYYCNCHLQLASPEVEVALLGCSLVVGFAGSTIVVGPASITHMNLISPQIFYHNIIIITTNLTWIYLKTESLLEFCAAAIRWICSPYNHFIQS